MLTDLNILHESLVFNQSDIENGIHDLTNVGYGIINNVVPVSVCTALGESLNEIYLLREGISTDDRTDYTLCGEEIFNKCSAEQKVLLGFSSRPSLDRLRRDKTLIDPKSIPSVYSDAISF